MGIFDYVVCHYDLCKSLSSHLVGKVWQTKDFGGGFDNYLITAEGELLKESSNQIVGSFSDIAGKSYIPCNYTGTITLTFLDDKFYETIIEFKKGRFVRVTSFTVSELLQEE